MKNLNQRIAYYRNVAGYTQEQAAEKLGIKTSTYSQMERDGNVYVERFFILSEFFNVPPCEMYYGVPSKCNEEKDESRTIPTGIEVTPQTANQPTPVIPVIYDDLVLSNSYKNHLKIVTNLSKEHRQAVFDLAHDLYIKEKNKE